MKIACLLLPMLAAMVLVGATADAACITGGCHQKLSQFAYPHAPVADDCLSCHVALTATHPQAGEKNFKLTADGAALCAQCHTAFPKKKTVHAPVGEGECLACHQVHGAAQPKLLDVGDNLAALCFNCHDEAPFRQDFRHGPVAAGVCTGCHDPHAADEDALLKNPLRTTCLECHADFAGKLQAAAVVHAPVKDESCTFCHDPHASAAKYILKKEMPALCFDCHEKVAENVAEFKVRHAPVDDAMSCSNCHSAHFANAAGLLAADEKTICLSCHGTDKLGNPPLKNIKKQLTAKPKKKDKKVAPTSQEPAEPTGQLTLHGPLQEDRCADCHNPHGSNYFRLLTGPYPEELYLPYQAGAYDFCLQCHEPLLLRYKETTIYTEFRNGNRNLHFVHVADNRKGRTCRTCHESHASTGKKLINEEGMPFGDWKVPIRFSQTETGGSCAPGCHRPLGYDREEPVNYRQSGL